MKNTISFFFFLFLNSFMLVAQTDGIPERPNPPKLVNILSKEFPDFISKSEENNLEQKLQAFANETSNQIVIVVVDDLGGMEAWDYATRLGHKWGVGQAKFDNGIIILIKPTGGEGQRDLHIAIGYGLEGAIPDLTTKQIRENEMYPYMRNGEFFTALDKATNVLMALAKGEYSSDKYGAKHKKSDQQKIKGIIIVIAIIIMILYSIYRGGRGGRRRGFTMGPGGIFWGASGFGRSSWGGGSSGGFGGGFGGFGGGGFGGGGSGGKW